MKEDYQKALKKLTLFFLSNPVPFNEQSYQKQKGRGTSDGSLFRLQVQKNFFICYILSDQVWWCNVKQFLSNSKNYTCKFMQVNWWHHKLFHFHFSFWIWKLWKRKEKTTKIWICQKRKELFGWKTKHFSVFLFKFIYFFLFLSTLSRFKRTNGSDIINDVTHWLA